MSGMARKMTFPTSPPPQTPSPYCCLPSAVLRVSRFEYSTRSSHVRGGLSGIEPGLLVRAAVVDEAVRLHAVREPHELPADARRRQRRGQEVARSIFCCWTKSSIASSSPVSAYGMFQPLLMSIRSGGAPDLSAVRTRFCRPSATVTSIFTRRSGLPAWKRFTSSSARAWPQFGAHQTTSAACAHPVLRTVISGASAAALRSVRRAVFIVYPPSSSSAGVRPESAVTPPDTGCVGCQIPNGMILRKALSRQWRHGPRRPASGRPTGAARRARRIEERAAMKVLFIGGTGKISSACAQLAVERGIEPLPAQPASDDDPRPLPRPPGSWRGDIRDPESARRALGDLEFDAVADFIAFTPDHIETDLEAVPGPHGPVRLHQLGVRVPEAGGPAARSPSRPRWTTPSGNTPATRWRARSGSHRPIARRSSRSRSSGRRTRTTGRCCRFDRRLHRGPPDAPWPEGAGARRRLLALGADPPPGFREGLRAAARQQPCHRRRVPHHLGRAADLGPDSRVVAARGPESSSALVHLPSDSIAADDADVGRCPAGRQGPQRDLRQRKIKRIVPDFAATIPYSRGAEEVMAWFDADPARQVVDERLNRLMDTMIAAYESIRP